MVKSILVNDNTHLLIVQKQTEMLEKRIRKTLSDITESAIHTGLKEEKLSDSLKTEIEELKEEIKKLNEI